MDQAPPGASGLGERTGREYLIEIVKQGAYVHVAALDPMSNTETVLVGSASATKQELTRLAIRKLEYVLAKNAQS
jgi:hypothetical protein